MKIIKKLNSLKNHTLQSLLLPTCLDIVGASLPIKSSLTYPRINENNPLGEKIISLAVFPKSGSTYLAALLNKLTGFPLKGAVQLSGHNEQDICELRLRSIGMEGALIQQHAKGTFNNLKLLQKYSIKPVVLVRNIFNVIVSNHDYFRLESDIVPMGYIHPGYWNMSEKEQFDFIITNMLPWYLNFYVSWHDASKTNETLWLTYEEFFADQINGVKRIINFYGIEKQYTEKNIKEAIQSMPTKGDRITVNRLNVGKSGRGEIRLSCEQKNKVTCIAEKWCLDDGCLEKIGIKL